MYISINMLRIISCLKHKFLKTQNGGFCMPNILGQTSNKVTTESLFFSKKNGLGLEGEGSHIPYMGNSFLWAASTQKTLQRPLRMKFMKASRAPNVNSINYQKIICK